MPKTKEPISSKVSNIRDNPDVGRAITANESLVKILQSKKKLDSPVLFAAFPGAGFVGSICANYIINKLHMVQIGSVESKFIVPGVICVEGELRHAFPLYSTDKGDICILVCEAPLMIEGMYSVLDTIVKWALNNGVKEIIVFDGIPVEGVPIMRNPIAFSGKDGKGDGPTVINNKSPILEKEKKEKEDPGTVYPPTSFIAGIAGGILSCCLSNKIPSKAFLIPAPRGKPDLEGAAILIESLGKITENKKLRIDTSQLRKEAEDRRSNIPARDDLWVGSSVSYNQLQSQIWYY